MSGKKPASGWPKPYTAKISNKMLAIAKESLYLWKFIVKKMIMDTGTARFAGIYCEIMNKYYDRDGCWENKAGALFFRATEAGASADRYFHYLYATGNGGFQR